MGKQLPGGFGGGGGGGFGSQQPTQMGAQQALGQMGGGGGMNLSAFNPQQLMSYAQPYMQSLGGFGGQQNFDLLQNLGNFGAQLMGSQQQQQQQPIMGAQGYINQAYQDARSQPTIQDFLRQQQMGNQPQQVAQFSSVPGVMQGQQPTIRDTRYDPVRDTPRPGGMLGGAIQQSLQDLSARLRGGAPQQAPQGLQQALNSVSQPPMMPGRPNTQQVRPEDARMQAMRRIQQMSNRMRNPLYGSY
jgi:hypothetical protein